MGWNPINEEQAQRIREQFKQEGLERYIEPLLPLFEQSIVMELHEAEKSEPVRIGVSHFGGVPDVPPGFVWPSAMSKEMVYPIYPIRREEPQPSLDPLHFIAQINLAEVAPFDEHHLLPATGMLYFFLNEPMSTVDE